MSYQKGDWEWVKRMEKEHILVPWAFQGDYVPKVITGAKGNYFHDSDGNEYLDFTSQLVNVNIGHHHPKVIKALVEGAQELCYMASGFGTEARARAAAVLAEISPGNLKKSFFTTGGAEAIEAAIKFCRAFTGRKKIFSYIRSYHGSTMGAMTLSGDARSWPFLPGITDVEHVLDPYCYRCPFGLRYPNCGIQCAKHIEECIVGSGGGEYIAAVFVEPIRGAQGIIVPPPEYMPMLRDICSRHGVLLVADEIMTGFGRTGQWFACENWKVVPDMMTMSKGITCAYVPFGAVIVSEQIAQFFENHQVCHGHTMCGHALGSAVAVAVIEVMKEENLVENSSKMGEVLLNGLKDLQEKHPSVGDVRGMGLFAAMELVKNRETKEPMISFNSPLQRGPNIKRKILQKMMDQGIYFNAANPGPAIMCAPPLSITAEEINRALEAFDKALEIADQELTR